MLGMSSNDNDADGAVAAKKPRTSEDFYLFCKFILDHENYTEKKEETISIGETEPAEKKHEAPESYLNGGDINFDISVPEMKSGSVTPSELPEGDIETNDNIHVKTENLNDRKLKKKKNKLKMKSSLDSDEELRSDEDSYDLITCFCQRPYSGRPMIECSECLTWIHLSCAKVRRSNIPDVFICTSCKGRDKS